MKMYICREVGVILTFTRHLFDNEIKKHKIFNSNAVLNPSTFQLNGKVCAKYLLN